MVAHKKIKVIHKMVCVSLSMILSASALIWTLSIFFEFWKSFEFVAACSVAVGCIGEWWQFLTPCASESLHSTIYQRHRLKELFFIMLVAIGVTMDVLALNHSFIESDARTQEVAVLTNQTSLLVASNLQTGIELEGQKSNNWILRSNVVALETQLIETRAAMNETGTNVAKLNPTNRNIFSISARAQFSVNANVEVDLPLGMPFGAAELLLCENDRNGSRFPSLVADSFERHNGISPHDPTNVLKRRYDVRFHASEWGSLEHPYWKVPAKDISKIKILQLYVRFLPQNTEILGGNVELVLNEHLPVRFQILPQKDPNPQSGTTNSLAGSLNNFWPYTIIATNQTKDW